MPHYVDANRIPSSDRLKAAITRHMPAIRAEAYDRNPRAAAIAESRAPGKLEEVVGILLANAIAAHFTGPGPSSERYVVCSMGRQHYTKSRYRPECWWTVNLVERGLMGLARAHLIDIREGSWGGDATDYALTASARLALDHPTYADIGQSRGAEIVILKARPSDLELHPEDRDEGSAKDRALYVEYEDTEDTHKCQGQPKFPQLWQSNFPHLVQESVVSSARTRPAFSFSLSRYELPRMFRVTA